MILNNVEVSGEYTLKLKQTLETEAERLFTAIDLEKVKTVLTDLSDAAKGIKTELLMVWIQLFFFNKQPYMEEVCNRIIPRVRIIFDVVGLKKVNYELNEEKFQEYEINDPFIEHFLLRLNDIVEQYKVCLRCNFSKIGKLHREQFGIHVAVGLGLHSHGIRTSDHGSQIHSLGSDSVGQGDQNADGLLHSPRK